MEIKKRISLPLELIWELVNFLPFDLKWANNRISLFYDIFVLKKQCKWIVNSKKTVDNFRRVCKDVFVYLDPLYNNVLEHKYTLEQLQLLHKRILRVWQAVQSFYCSIRNLYVGFNESFKKPYFECFHEWFAIRVSDNTEGIERNARIKIELTLRLLRIVIDLEPKFILCMYPFFLPKLKESINQINED